LHGCSPPKNKRKNAANLLSSQAARYAARYASFRIAFDSTSTAFGKILKHFVAFGFQRFAISRSIQANIRRIDFLLVEKRIIGTKCGAIQIYGEPLSALV
jgi:hypothetical protein